MSRRWTSEKSTTITSISSSRKRRRGEVVAAARGPSPTWLMAEMKVELGEGHEWWVPESAIDLTKRGANPPWVSSRLCRMGLFLTPAFLGFAYVLAALPEVAESSGSSVTGLWKYSLIATHVLVFVLIPVAMRFFYEALPALKVKRSGVFAAQLGFAFIMVSIASEIGWHVTQSWYYTNDFTMLNFMFYFFLITGFSLLADSMRRGDSWGSQAMDLTFAICLLGTSVLYPMGADAGDSSYKIPIYVTLTLITSVLTYRGWRALEDWRIVFYPVLSVGVNLFFIHLLNVYGNEAWSNALFHILHDLLGTEAGVAIFAWLVYQKIPSEE